ncbi:pantoate--beta-alanine ligase [Helicobacter suis]|uniref:pantoate--beta-alanine ligase n=1 Tax=Helicobacter suis TaxID=104628 RepID=UPI0013D0B0BD|nr:pantoate--beta-alanine ligase [Helicobacter suis]
MQFCTKGSDLSLFRGQEIGFVPTMGALHSGHANLIQKARAQNKIVIVSIFINPTQFGPHEDYKQYPRTLQADLELCEDLGVSAVFVPEPIEIYPFKQTIKLQAPPSLLGFEADMRPNHFEGVLQVVLKLFNLVRPKRAYFGRKDAQQLLIIQHMVADLFLDIEIVPCEIVRDSDGLALSSRNVYLSQEERLSALKLPQALMRIKKAINAGEKHSANLIQLGLDALQGLKVHYLAICDHHLAPLEQIEPTKTLILCAIQVGAVRLLDNLWV